MLGFLALFGRLALFRSLPGFSGEVFHVFLDRFHLAHQGVIHIHAPADQVGGHGREIQLALAQGHGAQRAKGYAAESGTTIKQVNTMAEAFEGADIVIPKSWAPFAAMEKRTNLYAEGDDAGIAALEKELLAQNATHQDWCSTTELMEKTANGQATIFMHPLPADISGVSCEHGEVNAAVFDMHRVGMYKAASYTPSAIAAMMFLQKVADPAATLKALDERNTARWLQA